ncbi:MAG: SH3 domain-containing protein [Spirochaetes bacterium]|nr:SH3 domain-containing protein [Spirochaetota bacterium]
MRIVFIMNNPYYTASPMVLKTTPEYDEIGPMKVKACFVLLLTLLSFGCGRRTIGYGVVLWSPEEQAVSTGAMVPVYEESRIKKTYIIGVPTQKAPYEIPASRVQVFRSRKEAEAFASQFESVRYLFAISERRALPIREKPDRLSKQVYRLRQDELIKILQLGTEPSDENGLKGHWHKVLAEDGTVGYCFDYYLTLYDGKSNTKVASTRDPSEERIALLLSTTWRPAYFQTMVSSRRIDLDRFKPEYGLFITLDPPLIRLQTPEVQKEFSFTTLSATSGNRFLIEGANISLAMDSSAKNLTITFQDRNEQKTLQFIAFSGDVEDIIQKEKERREKLLTSFLEKGQILRSSGFGEITLRSDGTFQWTDFDRLIPNVLGSGVRGTGRIEFSTFQDRSIQGEYDGSLTFLFDGGTTGKNRATFLYKFTDGGVRFLHIPQANIRENTIQRLSTTPLILFFTFQ